MWLWKQATGFFACFFYCIYTAYCGNQKANGCADDSKCAHNRTQHGAGGVNVVLRRRHCNVGTVDIVKKVVQRDVGRLRQSQTSLFCSGRCSDGKQKQEGSKSRQKSQQVACRVQRLRFYATNKALKFARRARYVLFASCRLDSCCVGRLRYIQFVSAFCAKYRIGSVFRLTVRTSHIITPFFADVVTPMIIISYMQVVFLSIPKG